MTERGMPEIMCKPSCLHDFGVKTSERSYGVGEACLDMFRKAATDLADLEGVS
ncbi:hypothetical protein ENSA7_70850 [Enhygromyxa salina]|uniref:Uncharacterized protein n=1 Tax=Enhygromyxa salina TaxID=215803 RepID=A0A2S9XU65_9BACT|nr:hypothetical protein ENSA7_70850 [Enhygromyxa salina]